MCAGSSCWVRDRDGDGLADRLSKKHVLIDASHATTRPIVASVSGYGLGALGALECIDRRMSGQGCSNGIPPTIFPPVLSLSMAMHHADKIGKIVLAACLQSEETTEYCTYRGQRSKKPGR